MGSVTNSRAGRMLAAAAALATVAILASGCAQLTNLSQHLAGLTTEPKIGECWTTTFQAAQASEDWEGTPALACSKAHQSYTYAMTKLTKKFSGSWLTVKGAIRTDVDQNAYAACKKEQTRILPGITVKEALLYPTYYLPSVAMWNAGSRWVRCDITEIKFGSTVAKPRLANLTTSFATLVSTLENDPQKFALCEDDPASNGPDGAATTYADCTGPADWTFVADLTMAGANGTSYPGASALKALGTKQCATLKTPAGHTVFVEPPSKNDWTKYDDRELDCWVNNN
jgi:hypothetical protein